MDRNVLGRTRPRGTPSPLRTAAACTLGATLLGLALTWPAAGLYDDASVRAILFNRERADSLGAPLVLLAHRTDCSMQGNGPRSIEEHWLWYIADPDDAAVARLREPNICLQTGLESFGLERCRIFRGGDTLIVDPGLWHLRPPAGWPGQVIAWQEVTAQLPEFARGDILELAYRVINAWERTRLPSDWEALPIRHPLAPTIERMISIQSNSTIKGRAKVFGDAARLVRHYGPLQPRFELLTGDLPVGLDHPLALAAPRVLFTADTDWLSVQRVLQRNYMQAIAAVKGLCSAAGDSLALVHRSARGRLSAVLGYVDTHWARIPRTFTEGSCYAGPPAMVHAQGAADDLDRALLTAGLMQAAHLQVDLFLGRDRPESFVEDLPTPLQFDRVILGAVDIEGDARLLFDPRLAELTASQAATRGLLLFDLSGPETVFYEVNHDGLLTRRAPH